MNAHLNKLVKMKNTKNKFLQVVPELLDTAKTADCLDLATVAKLVKSHSGTMIPLVKPKSYHVRLCGQDDTVYAGNEEQLEAWKDFYLSERMEMEVIGAIDDFPCEAFGLQLVLLLCEDGNVYAYEDEVLHLVARSLKELFETGMTFPGFHTYKIGECFEDYTQEEYDEMMETTEMKELIGAHEKFCESLETEMLQSLMELRNTQIKTESALAPDGEVGEGAVHSTKSECRDIVLRKTMPVLPWRSSVSQSLPMSCTV